MFEALMIDSGPPAAPQPTGQVEWTVPGTYQWIVPADVTKVSCVVIAAGQSGGYSTSSNTGKAGDGGGLRWKNSINVTPGATMTIIVGAQDVSPGDLVYTQVWTPAANTRSAALGIEAYAGTAGTTIGPNGVGGGVGGTGNTSSAFSGITTPGASGGYTNGNTPRANSVGKSGDGADLYGNALTNGSTAAPLYPSDGASYGGGGQTRNADNSSSVKRVRRGASGAVRIMWGTGRAYPSTLAQNL